MEIDKTKINKSNAADQPHGYLDSLGLRSHYYNDIRVGFFWGSFFKCHFLNGKEIGCEELIDVQYFYNKSGKKFGEEIKWK